MARATIKVVIRNRLGLHARPAMAFVDLASSFACEVKVRRPDTGEEVDGKSIMQMMMLSATQGTDLEVTADGGDADRACEAIRGLVERGFDEDG